MSPRRTYAVAVTILINLAVLALFAATARHFDPMPASAQNTVAANDFWSVNVASASAGTPAALEDLTGGKSPTFATYLAISQQAGNTCILTIQNSNTLENRAGTGISNFNHQLPAPATGAALGEYVSPIGMKDLSKWTVFPTTTGTTCIIGVQASN